LQEVEKLPVDTVHPRLPWPPARLQYYCTRLQILTTNAKGVALITLAGIEETPP
jgi:hypothetical protein